MRYTAPKDALKVDKIFLNGKDVTSRCRMADTKKGKVELYDQPPRLDKHKKRILTRRKYGKVEVKLYEKRKSPSNKN